MSFSSQHPSELSRHRLTLKRWQLSVSCSPLSQPPPHLWCVIKVWSSPQVLSPITLCLVISPLNWPVLVISSKLRTSKPVFNEEREREQRRGVRVATYDTAAPWGVSSDLPLTYAHTLFYTDTHVRQSFTHPQTFRHIVTYSYAVTRRCRNAWVKSNLHVSKVGHKRSHFSDGFRTERSRKKIP